MQSKTIDEIRETEELGDKKLNVKNINILKEKERNVNKIRQYLRSDKSNQDGK